MKKLLAFFVALSILTFGSIEIAHAISAGPTLILKNQYGEQSNNWVLPGGSNQIDANFVVDATNGNGLGIRSLKGAGVAKVYMHTSATPAVGNPNPATGYIVVQLSKVYQGYIGGYAGFVQPVSGTPIPVASPGVTAGSAYVIVSVGSTTPAGFQSLGLALGVTPAVGAAFVASTTGEATGSGAVETTIASGVDHLEVVGDPNQTLSATGGAIINLVALASGVAAAPANGSVIGLRFVYQ